MCTSSRSSAAGESSGTASARSTTQSARCAKHPPQLHHFDLPALPLKTTLKTGGTLPPAAARCELGLQSAADP